MCRRNRSTGLVTPDRSDVRAPEDHRAFSPARTESIKRSKLPHAACTAERINHMMSDAKSLVRECSTLYAPTRLVPRRMAEDLSRWARGASRSDLLPE